jgi:hypothetical protein
MVQSPQNIHTKAFITMMKKEKNVIVLDGNKIHISPNKAHEYHGFFFQRDD